MRAEESMCNLQIADVQLERRGEANRGRGEERREERRGGERGEEERGEERRGEGEERRGEEPTLARSLRSAPVRVAVELSSQAESRLNCAFMRRAWGD